MWDNSEQNTHILIQCGTAMGVYATYDQNKLFSSIKFIMFAQKFDLGINYVGTEWSDVGQECHRMKPPKHEGVFPV